MTDSSPARGEVWWVDFEPATGSEPRKIRPAIVVSAAEFDHLGVRLVAPLTTWQDRFRNHPNKVRVNRSDLNGLALDSAADAMLTTATALERFGERLGTVDAQTLSEIVSAIGLILEFAD